MATRTRQRSTPFGSGQERRYTRYILESGGGLPSSTPVVFPTSVGVSTSETITDETGPKTRKVRPLTHVKETNTLFAVTSVSEPYHNGGYQDGVKVIATDYRENFSYNGYPAVPASIWGNLNQYSVMTNNRHRLWAKALRDQTTHIRPAFSIPNFLLDMDEIPKLLGTLKSLQRFGYRTAKNMRLSIQSSGRARENLRKSIVSSSLKEFSNAHLAWNFGVRPLLSDIEKSFGVIDRVFARIQHLKRTYGKKTKFRRYFPQQAAGLSSEPTWSNVPNFGWVRWIGDGYSESCAVGGELFHTLGGLDDISRQVGALLADTGFYSPMAVVWDAIPLSFLVDYVSNLGELISSYTLPVFEGDIVATEVWSSLRINWSATMMYRSPQGITAPAFRKEYAAYHRYVGANVNPELLFGTHGLKNNQIANALAIAAQRAL